MPMGPTHRRRAERAGSQCAGRRSPPRSPAKPRRRRAGARRSDRRGEGDRRRRCASGERKAVLLGNAAGAASRQAAALLERLAHWIADADRRHRRLAGRRRQRRRRAARRRAARARAACNAGQMLGAPRRSKACLLLNVEPGARRRRRRRASPRSAAAEMVVAHDRLQDAVDDVADVLLPIAPFTETSGTFVNAEGRVQSFHGVVQSAAATHGRRGRCCACSATCSARQASSSRRRRKSATRPSATSRLIPAPRPRAPMAVRAPASAAGPTAGRSNASPTCRSTPPIPIVRRAPALQLPRMRGAACGRRARALSRAERGTRRRRRRCASRQGGGAGRPAGARSTRRSRPTCVRVAAGHPLTAALGPMFGALTIDVVAAAGGDAATRRVEATPVVNSTRSAATAAACSAATGRSSGAVTKIVALAVAAAALRRLPDALGAQGHRLEPDPSRPEPGRPVRPAAADRRCGQADLQGDHRPDGGEQAACSSSAR